MWHKNFGTRFILCEFHSVNTSKLAHIFRSVLDETHGCPLNSFENWFYTNWLWTKFNEFTYFDCASETYPLCCKHHLTQLQISMWHVMYFIATTYWTCQVQSAANIFRIRRTTFKWDQLLLKIIFQQYMLNPFKLILQWKSLILEWN